LGLLGCSIVACDPSVFDIPRDGDRGDSQAADAGALSTDSGPRQAEVRAGAGAGASAGAGAGAAGKRATVAANGGDSGTPAAGGAAGSSFGGIGSAPDAGNEPEPETTGGAGQLAETGGSGGAAANGGSGAAAAGNGSAGAAASGAGGVDSVPDLGALSAPSCPSMPAGPGDAFCYDFEQGHKGPLGGEVYLLWDTPDMPAETELAALEQPLDSGNHVLFASPRLGTSYPSATIGHDTHRFARALVEFDFWANDALLNVDGEVVIFRFVPDERDFNHVTNLILRRGQALLHLEDASFRDLPLTRAPSAADKTHVSVVLDRSSTCSVQIYFDAEQVLSSEAVTCAPDGEVGFVEYGLVVLGDQAEPIEARYDNIALGLE
jgi:hypothetical protein